MNYPLLISAAACLLLLMAGGHWLYFIPTAKISIDVNPSIELGINRFDQVVSVEAYNEDGQELADALNIKYVNYVEAVNQILENESVAALLAGDEVMLITVIDGKEGQSFRLLSGVEACAAGHQNTYCYSSDTKEEDAAHQAGMSCGKYRAFLEIQSLNPHITAEEIRGMTMREIWDLIDSLKAEKGTYEPPWEENGQGRGQGRHGGGHGHGHGNGSGRHR